MCDARPFTGLDPISMGVISNLVRRLNDALGGTSIVVTHDVQESLKIVDYVYFMADGGVAAQGTPDEIRNSDAPFVHQFVWGEIDGPMPFHYPGAPYRADLELEAGRGCACSWAWWWHCRATRRFRSTAPRKRSARWWRSRSPANSARWCRHCYSQAG